jgi:hypothetical protein
MLDHWITFGTSLLGFLTAVVGFLILFKKVQQVHVLVNSNLTKVMARLGIEQERSTQLHDTLASAGVEIPPRPSQEKEL